MRIIGGIMKIIPGPPPVGEIAGKNAPGKGKKAVEGEFGKVFEKTLETTETGKAQIAQIPKSGTLSPLQYEQTQALQKKELFQRVENLIDTLDQYREKLADPGASLKEIDPILQDLMDQKDALAPDMGALKDEDGLKPVLNQALVTVSLEVTKFKSGYYVD